MSVLLSCQSISKTYHKSPLFEDLSLVIHEQDRVGLIGPNGAGKSTLLKILAGIETPDNGELSRRSHTKLSYVEQRSTFPPEHTIEQVILEQLANAELEEYERQTEASIALSKVGFEDHQQRVSALSGGWKKRLAFACAIAQQPDILLLDEPTNHLDLEGISWLEGWLKQAPFAWMVISHDRYFLENVATSVIELHRVYKGGLLRVDGNYSAFLERKQEYMIAQEQYQSSLATRMRREKEWLQRGPKARTTKAKARIDEAGRLESELQSVKERTSQSGRQAQIDFTATGRRTKELIVAEHVEKEMGGKPLLGGLSFKLTPQKRIGILGANGSGKTTLLRMITGELEPDQGTLERAEQLQIVYFAQERYPLDLSVTLRKALAPDGDSVVFRESSVHVVSWSRRFLFRDEQLDIKLHLLSGGEQARVRIARLMLEPADILLLDEPTNDLDIETLEILEENLLSFPGALVLVTHDRYLLDRVCDTVIGITDEGKAEWFADFRQWEQHQASLAKASKQRAKQQAQTTTTPDATPTKRVKMSYNEKKELQQMEETILEAETHLEECQEAVANPDIASDAALLQEWYEKLQQAEAEVERLYARWTELEQKKANS